MNPIPSDSEIFDIIGHFLHPNPGTELPKTPIICKPSEAAIERALKIAGLNPQRTVREREPSYSSLIAQFTVPIPSQLHFWS